MEKDPLNALHDIHLPDPGGFWPPAPGWWLIALVVIAALTWLSIWLLHKRRRNRWIQLALHEVTDLEHNSTSKAHQLAGLNQLLKRAARQRYPTQRPQSLSGEAWVAFLVETSPGNKTQHQTVFTQLAQSSWRPDSDLEPSQAIAVVRYWLRGQGC